MHQWAHIYTDIIKLVDLLNVFIHLIFYKIRAILAYFVWCKYRFVENSTEHIRNGHLLKIYVVHLCRGLIQLVFSACVSGVKCRPILYHCVVVVIFFCSSGIMDLMLLSFEKGVPLMRYSASVVWHLSLLLTVSLIETHGDILKVQALLP